MDSTTNVRGALRDLFQFHFSSYGWLPAVFLMAAVGALVVLLVGILHVQAGPGWVPPAFREALAFRAVICWAVSVVCAYAGGFVVGRLYAAEPEG